MSKTALMAFERFVCGPLENNVFLALDEQKKVGAIIDPALGSNVALKMAKEIGIKIQLILNTHGHPDHTIEDAFIKKETGAKLAIHKLDEYRLKENSKIVTPYIQAEHQLVKADQNLKTVKSSKLALLN
ncbi:MAG: MBL fold metallo-hydrolase [Candidatus Diapherotrites archaeon]|nr:MBL fold metallo-hydrolase [Candidatus Diapherotrites archaeon]